jgi:hypothetical protein
MNHITEFDNLTKATRQREFEDGLMDFVFGGTILMVGLLGWFFFSSLGLRLFFVGLIKNREVTIIAFIAVIALLILFIFGARRMIERIRRKTLWKNQGFVKSLRWQVSWQINTLASAVGIAMIVIAVWLMSNGYVIQEIVLRTLVSSTGVATGIVFFGMGKELELQRYKWAGIVGGMLSTLVILMPISFSISWLVLGIGWIVVLTVSGSWALRKSILALREQNSE